MKQLNNRLKELNACSEAMEWVGDKSLKEAWKKCKRGDWMLWYYFREVGFTKELVKAKADCASLVKHLMEDQRSLDALQACYDYVDGNLNEEELRRAADAAYVSADYASSAYTSSACAAYAADAAYAASAAADYAAFYISVYAASAYASSAVAAYAAVVVADAAADYAAAQKETLKECSDICREVLTESLFKNVGK